MSNTYNYECVHKRNLQSIKREAERYGLEAEIGYRKLVLTGDEEALKRAHSVLMRLYGHEILAG